MLVPVREKVKGLTEKKMYINFTLQQTILECLNQGLVTCSAQGPERLLWAGWRVTRINSTAGVARSLLSYICNSTARILFKNALAARVMQ